MKTRKRRASKGIGVDSAKLLRAESGDIRRFADKHWLCSYVGAGAAGAGIGGQAGTKRNQAARIARATLDQGGSGPGGEALPSGGPELCAFRSKKHVAGVALARKLLVAVWALLRLGVAFDESFSKNKDDNELKASPPPKPISTLRWSDGDRTYLMCLEHQ